MDPREESTVPHEGFSVKNQHWQLVQHALLSLFRRDNPYSPIPFELHVIYESMVVLKKSEIGPLIPEYYKEHLLKKAMSSLRQKLDSLDSYGYLMKVSEDWLNMKDILPSLELIFYDFKELKIRQVTLQHFRDRYVVKEVAKLRNAMENCNYVPADIENMFYILYDLTPLDSDRCSPNERPIMLTLQFIITRRKAATTKTATSSGNTSKPSSPAKHTITPSDSAPSITSQSERQPRKAVSQNSDIGDVFQEHFV